MLVDCEHVLLDLKREIALKSHHGQRDLLAAIARLEVKHEIAEGLPEEALRLYGLDFFMEAVRTPSSPDGRVWPVDGDKDRALRGDSTNESQEDNHARHGTDPGERPGDYDGNGTGATARVTSLVGRSRSPN